MRVRYTGQTTPYLDYHEVYDAISEDRHTYSIVIPKTEKVEVFLKSNFEKTGEETPQEVYDKYMIQLADQDRRVCCRLKRC